MKNIAGCFNSAWDENAPPIELYMLKKTPLSIEINLKLCQIIFNLNSIVLLLLFFFILNIPLHTLFHIINRNATLTNYCFKTVTHFHSKQ